MRENSRGKCGVACSSGKHPLSAVTSKMFCSKGFACAKDAWFPKPLPKHGMSLGIAWIPKPQREPEVLAWHLWPCSAPSLGVGIEILINTSNWRNLSELWNKQVLRLELRIKMQSSPRPLLMQYLCRLDCSAHILFAEDKSCCGQHSIHRRWMLFCQCTSTQLGREMETAAWTQPGT